MPGMNGVHKPAKRKARRKKANGMNGVHKSRSRSRAGAAKRRKRSSKRKG